MKKRTLETLQIIAWILGGIALVLLIFGVLRALVS